jgi:hypothetical protein
MPSQEVNVMGCCGSKKAAKTSTKKTAKKK